MKNYNIKDFNPQLLQDLKQFTSFRSNLFHPKSDIIISKKNLSKQRKVLSQIDIQEISILFRKRINEEVISINKIEIKSTFHRLYKIITLKKSYILKINSLNDLYKDFTFFNEKHLQNVLKQNNLPYIDIYFIDLTRREYPFDFMIMEYIEGYNLEMYKGVNQKELYEEIGRIFKNIHSIETSKAGNLDLKILIEKDQLTGMFRSWEN